MLTRLIGPIATAALVAAWLILAVIAFATLAPIHLRPHAAVPVSLERFLAFAALGFAFALSSRRLLLVLVLLVAFAGALEWLQTMTASRHGRLADFAVKAAGIVIGMLAGAMARWLAQRHRSLTPPR